MSWLFNLSADISLAIGLIIAGIAIALLGRMGILPKKTIPYAILAAGAAVGLAWFRARKRGALRKQLEEQEKELKALEERMIESRDRFTASDEHLNEVRAEVEARRFALNESIVALEAEHEARMREIDGLQSERLDDEMTALLARHRARRSP